MPNTGTLEITLLTVSGQPAHDPATQVTIARTSDGRVLASPTLSFPPTRRLALPAFPDEHALACTITPQRYRSRAVGVFTLMDGETIARQPTVFRLPKEWTAVFEPWDGLSDEFLPLQEVLEGSPDIRVKGGRRYDHFTAESYDEVAPDDRVTIYAKACLLNLFAKLRSVNEPVHNRKPWFAFVDRILEFGRERFIALVQDDLFERVRAISDDIDDFEGYERTNALNHHGNIPAGYTVPKTQKAMVSVKTDEDHGNLQITAARGVDRTGAAVTLLDTDMDENGRLMAHLADLFKHKFTGGTYPFDIHEYLLLEAPNRALGYRLI